MSTTLGSRYEPKEAQQTWYEFWERNGYFHAEPDERPPEQRFTIVIPPPNVTGALHMGHALNNTLQDILIRWRRMQGANTLWVPGTDHAGIATQAVVEKRIREQEGKTRRELGRDELLRRIWAWKDDYERRILNQLRRLGSSCDWKRTRFTLDPVCVRAVRETFFRMFRDGLIYRGKRLVNWDAQLQTSVADDETYTDEVQGGFWTFQYPVTGTADFIRFSTTRPETMLGDTAVAVHPHDPRYQHLIGKSVHVPLVDREIPIIADGILADPSLGTGAVKVTPAHDPNDYACWQRQKGQIAILNILNPDGTINEHGGKYSGLDRYAARERVTADMEQLGLFEGREDRVVPLKYSDRSKSPIEPYLSDQWFVRMSDPPDTSSNGLAELAMRAVRDGRVRFHPERYAKTYLDWLGEKRDWCISRQLWWGHRIPVWTASHLSPDQSAALETLRRQHRDRMHVAPSSVDPAAGPNRPSSDPGELVLVCLAPEADAIIPDLERIGFTQDPDVLDTWFSAQLWPHSTLGWPGNAPPTKRSGAPLPEQPPDWNRLQYYYPTSTLVTSRDIITLWVARMIIAGLYNCGDVPFRDVYITPKILDGFGQTMSKSKGNGVDPLDIIDKYGADALRFGIAYMATDLQDSRLPVGYECPHCQTYIAQKIEHQQMKPKEGKKPRIKCPNCKKDFQFSSPNFDADPGEPVARVVSDRFELGRNFANKLWNAARFVLMNLDDYQPPAPPNRTPDATPALADDERWILSRLADATDRVTEHLENYRFSEAAKSLYEFAWSEYCDWYVEMAKLRLRDPRSRPVAQHVLAHVLDHLLRLLHPIMPFVTEHIWQALGERARVRGVVATEPAAASVMIAAWPARHGGDRAGNVEQRMERLQGVIRAVRNIRSTFNVDPKNRVAVHLRCAADTAAELIAAEPFVAQLAGVDRFTAGPDVSKPSDSVSAVAPDWELYVPLTGLIDRAAEIERNRKLLQSLESQWKSVQVKLSNESFTAKAPPDVVAQHREKAAELDAQRHSIESILRDLGGTE